MRKCVCGGDLGNLGQTPSITVRARRSKGEAVVVVVGSGKTVPHTRKQERARARWKRPYFVRVYPVCPPAVVRVRACFSGS